MSRSKHSPEEKLQSVIQSVDHNTSEADHCRFRKFLMMPKTL
jgi:hypothetical protein